METIKTTQYIKSAFISDVLTESAEKIRQAQQVVVSEWNLFDTGETEKYTKGHFTAVQAGGGARLVMRYVKQFRLLDIKDPRRKLSGPKREGYHLYNRINFGILYNFTYPTMRYGFVEEVREQYLTKTADALGIKRDQLQQVLNKHQRQKIMGIN